MHTSLIIPAKGTSERVKNKNLFKINGKTLVEHACEKALQCKNIHKVYLDTESDQIIMSVDHLLSRGLELIRRPKELADNDTGANEMLVYAMHTINDTDLILQTFSTSPLITSDTIDYCVDKFIKAGKEYDSFFTVMPMKEYFWGQNKNAANISPKDMLTDGLYAADHKPMNFNINELPNSQDLDEIYMETHGLYGITTKALMENKTRVGKSPLLIPVSKMEAFDIDDHDDLEIVKRMMVA